LDSSPLSEFYSNPDYKFDFGSDPEEPESEHNSTELPLSGPASGLVITSTPAGRFIYWPNNPELRSIQDVGYYAPRGPNLSKLCATCLFLRVTYLGEATFIYFGYSP
jgi:hypothetical protein